ncbi:MAG TPA: FAD-dependent oxidoreductase, partial [Woeseiaceae bacterium]
MGHVVVVGAGTGGVPAAYELRATLSKEHEVTLINATPKFQFVPSNPWVAVGWRQPDDITVDLPPLLARRGVKFIAQAVAKIDAGASFLDLADGARIAYDYLVLATGPGLAFDEIPGFGAV